MVDLTRMIKGGMDLATAFGGGSGNSSAYRTAMGDVARMEALVTDAASKRNALQAQMGLGAALEGLGAPAELAKVFAAGHDPTKLSQYMGDMQEQGFRGNAASQALAGDWDGANANLMGVANGPQALAAVQGQNLLGNVFLQGGGGVSTTEQGRASMAADAARARASDASAASSYATADSTRRRAAIAESQFALQRSGQWNPGGSAAGGTAGGGELKLTEGQSKDMVYLRRGSEANALLDKYANNLTMTGGDQGWRGIADSVVRGLPFGLGEGAAANVAVSGERQQAEQAAKEFLSAILRKDTGAAITNQEIEIYGKTYLPQPGDSESTLQQKARARQVALEAIETGLGPERARLAMPTAADVFNGNALAPAQMAPRAAPGTRRRYNPATGRIE